MELSSLMQPLLGRLYSRHMANEVWDEVLKDQVHEIERE